MLNVRRAILVGSIINGLKKRMILMAMMKAGFGCDGKIKAVEIAEAP